MLETWFQHAFVSIHLNSAPRGFILQLLDNQNNWPRVLTDTTGWAGGLAGRSGRISWFCRISISFTVLYFNAKWSLGMSWKIKGCIHFHAYKWKDPQNACRWMMTSGDPDQHRAPSINASVLGDTLLSVANLRQDVQGSPIGHMSHWKITRTRTDGGKKTQLRKGSHEKYFYVVLETALQIVGQGGLRGPLGSAELKEN